MRYNIASGLIIIALSYGDCLPLEQFSYAVVLPLNAQIVDLMPQCLQCSLTHAPMRVVRGNSGAFDFVCGADNNTVLLSKQFNRHFLR
jgi:hypothetical protein